MTAPEHLTSHRDVARVERVERRRREILTAAASIMYRTGYHQMSMQSVADEAGMSVGLIYQYYGNKGEVLLAVIVDILEGFRQRIPAAIEGAGADPREQVARGFRVLCEVIDSKPKGTLLAYRESQTLDEHGRAEIIRLEDETLEPLRRAVGDGIDAGIFRPVSPQLIAHNLKMAAHGWALKHWDLSRRMTLEQYIDAQLELLFAGICVPEQGSGASAR